MFSKEKTCRGVETIPISAPIVFSLTIIKRSAVQFTCCRTAAACFTTFSFFKQAPSFTSVSPRTPHFPLFRSHSSRVTAPAAWLARRSPSQRTSSSVYQSCAHFHWEPLCAVGSVAKKGTDGEQETWKTREGGGARRKERPHEPRPDSAGEVI